MPFVEHTKSPVAAELAAHIVGEQLVGEQSGFNFSPGCHYNPSYIPPPYNPAYIWAQPANAPPSVPLSPRWKRRRALVAQRGVAPAQEQPPRQSVKETLKTETPVNHLSYQPVQSSHQLASGADPWAGYPTPFATHFTSSNNSPEPFSPAEMQPSSGSIAQFTYAAESDPQSPQKSMATARSPDQPIPAYDWRSLAIFNDPKLIAALNLLPATSDSSLAQRAVSGYDSSATSSDAAFPQYADSLPASPSAVIRGRKPDNEQKYRTNVKNCQDELKDAVEKAPEALRPAGLRLNTKATIQSSAARLIRHLISYCKQQARELHRLKQENQSLQQQLQARNPQQSTRLTCNTTLKY